MTAACAGSPLNFHSDDPAVQEACKAVCGGCELRASCLAGAIARDEPCGVWGGRVFGVVEMAGPDEPQTFLRVAIYAPAHGSRTRYVSGCRCDPCTAANTTYKAQWWVTHTPAPVGPPVDLPLALFDEIAPVTAREKVNA